MFESLFGPEDAVISDALNHASIIDGIRLCKAQRFRYANQDMADLEAKLIEAATQENPARRKIIVTDGVFSMDGYLAPLEAICDLAEKYDALVMVDDSHAVGFMGATGAGTPEHAGVSDRVDIYTGTFGKALGGASGGYVSGRGEVVAMLRQKARPYLFSNSLAPAIVAATLKALDLVENSGELRGKLFANAALFRSRMTEEGFDLLPGEHAIVPVMFGDAVHGRQGGRRRCCSNGVFVTAFSFPVVPKGAARIRVQLSAAHSADDVEACVRAFVAQPRRRRRLKRGFTAESDRRPNGNCQQACVLPAGRRLQGWDHGSTLRCRDCRRRHRRPVPGLRPGRAMQRGAGGSRADPGVPHLVPLGPAADPQLRPARGPGTHRPHPGTDRRPGRRTGRNRCCRRAASC